ncbi:MAG: hypothetical protein J6U22_03835 [Bacteroidaceae bacterium]|nr:hypothetical protein [Bacteroidaceae bacterium]
MRKYSLFAIMALAAIVFISCDKDKDDGKDVSDSGLTGTWVGCQDDYHYPVVTFKNDGKYEWQWDGIAKLKDTGKYTYANNEIRMNPSEYYEFDTERKDFQKVITPEYFSGTRRCKVYEINEGIMSIEVFGDYFMGGDDEYGFPYTLFKEGTEQNITQSELKGTWENYDEKGNVTGRVVFDGNRYTWYNVWGWDGAQLEANKTVGTWSVSKGQMSLNPTDMWYSFETGVDSNNKTVYNYSTVDPKTFEAEKWTKTIYSPRSSTDRVYLAGGKLYMGRIFLIRK